MTRAKDISKIVTDADLSGTLDVAGTVTAGGLTVNGTADVDNLIIDNAGKISSVGQIEFQVDNDNNQSGTYFGFSRNNTTSERIALFQENGDISFYEDTGTTPKLFWDASAESLGIGTTSPATSLSPSAQGLAIQHNNAPYMSLDNTGSSGRRYTMYSNTGGNLVTYDEDAASTRMVIDSSGNVGIGTSSPNSYAGYTALTLNHASNGGIIDIERNGVLVGEIYTTDANTFSLNAFGAKAISFRTNSTERMRIDSAGHVTMPYQSAFQVRKSANQNNVSASDSAVTVSFDTEVFDVNSDFASNIFTAPVTGKYFLSINVYLAAIDTATSYILIGIRTSNRDYYRIVDPNFSSDLSYYGMNFSVLADLDASDTAYIWWQSNGGTAQVDIVAANGTQFQGHLLS